MGIAKIFSFGICYSLLAIIVHSFQFPESENVEFIGCYISRFLSLFLLKNSQLLWLIFSKGYFALGVLCMIE